MHCKAIFHGTNLNMIDSPIEFQKELNYIKFKYVETGNNPQYQLIISIKM